MPPGPLGKFQLVPTSKTPQPQAQACEREGWIKMTTARRLDKSHEREGFIKRDKRFLSEIIKGHGHEDSYAVREW
jgi:hypothetical protein